MFRVACSAGVAQGPLHGDDVAAGGDQTAGVEVAHVVETGRPDIAPRSRRADVWPKASIDVWAKSTGRPRELIDDGAPWAVGCVVVSECPVEAKRL